MRYGMRVAGVIGALAVLGACSRSSAPAREVIPAASAGRIFAEAGRLCQAEGGALWGKSLCGPMLFADPATRQAVLNGPSPGAVRDGAVYRLQLPAGTGVANTAIELAGQRWTMLRWPLPEKSAARSVLLMHESYHRIQPDLGLEGSGGLGANLHLDTREGRVWLRAELRALSSALRSQGDARRRALADAVLFRAYRRSLWPGASAEERGLELNEGLAESTGIDAALREPDARIEAALGDIAGCEAAPSFVRSFAYATGPAYAELLDAADAGWRRKVTAAFDFGSAAAAAYGIASPPASKSAAGAAFERYGGSDVVAQEDVRSRAIEERNARFTRLFLDGPTVRFRLARMKITFNPREVSSFAGHGSVYGTVELSDDWGTLEVVSGAALVSPDFKTVTVPAAPRTGPEHPEGIAWKVRLAEGYTLVPDPASPGSFAVRKR